MGTKTKVVAALLILINVLVLVNLRVPLSRVGRKYSLSRQWGGEGKDGASGSTNDASGVWAGESGWKRPQGSPPQTKQHIPGEVVVVFPYVGPDVEEHRDGDGREPVRVVVEKSALEEEAEEEECRDMVESLKIVPNKSWGKAEKPQQQRWDLLDCNAVVEGKKARRAGPIDCTSRPSQPSDPLIAICAGTTTRGVPLLEEHSLALFRFLLPSLGRTAECGFNYIAVIGYDVGDEFFDTELGKERLTAYFCNTSTPAINAECVQVMSWFDSEVMQPAASRGLKIQLELVRVENEIRKPGPVFTATTKVAYDRGANYTYRVNDDSEMVDPWAGKFVETLKAMGPPYGVVGPESLNNNILVHDFTHRLHMDIFEGQYYPESLTDWYVDDWISRVYGRRRTVRAKNCKVEHHTGAHGQRYKADTSKARTVGGLVEDGAKRIVRWAELNGAEQAAQDIAGDSLDGWSAKKDNARIIP